MIAISAYRKLFPKVDGVIGYVAMPGNVGDTLISVATLGLLRKWRIPHEEIDLNRLKNGKLPRHITRLYISGGGNMGDLYPQNKIIRNLACSKNRPVIVLPQTFTNVNENISRYEQVWVRERESLKMCPGARLAPDMAMYLKLDSRAGEARKPLGVFLREDKESRFPGHNSSYGDPVSLGTNIASYLELIVPYQHIVTDRLHFAIAAMLMSRKVTLLPNSYFKNRSMWETWLRKRGCHWANHPDQVDRVKSRRVNKLISPAESLQLPGIYKIKRTRGWRAIHGQMPNTDHWLINTGVAKYKIGRRSRVIWEALDQTRTCPELRAILKGKSGVNSFKLDKILNSNLRKLFSMGVIEITPVHRKSPASTCMPLGGNHGIPIEVTVSAPVRIEQDIYLFADIRRNGKLIPIWYRIDYRYAAYLSNTADNFLLSTLHVAMRSGSPLWLRGAAVTLESLTNIQQYQSVWSLWHKYIDEIAIHADIVEPESAGKSRKRRAITCFSGGVDSMFTLYNQTINAKNRYKLPLTDALLVHGFDITISEQFSFDDVQEKCQRVASDLNINLITIATNIRRLKMDWRKAHVAVAAGAMHLVSAPFTHGLVPSTLNYGILYPWGSTPLTDPMLSSATLKLASDGADYTRVGKIRAMKAWETGLRDLRFCSTAYPANHNCGKCGKCTTTAIMIVLAKVCRESIKPFPGHRRLALQLQRTKISRLDKSDFRDEMEDLEKLRDATITAPIWVHLLLRKLQRV